MSKIYAVIAEGKGEMAVIDILLDNDKLIFTRDEMLDKEVLTTRNAKIFENKHLNFSMEKEVHVYRILDSSNENFKLSRKDVIVHDIITSREIEVLIIIDLNLYSEYKKFHNQKKKNNKPSDFLKKERKDYHKGKTYWEEYFTDVQILISCINEYDRISKHKNTLKKLLK